MGNIGKATEPRSINNQWQPTQVTDIYLTVPCTPFINRFMYSQHVPVYDLKKKRGDCLIKWLIMLGFMDLRGPRVCRRSTPVLLMLLSPESKVHGANMGPTWALSAPDGPHDVPMNLAIRVCFNSRTLITHSLEVIFLETISLSQTTIMVWNALWISHFANIHMSYWYVFICIYQNF